MSNITPLLASLRSKPFPCMSIRMGLEGSRSGGVVSPPPPSPPTPSHGCIIRESVLLRTNEQDFAVVLSDRSYAVEPEINNLHKDLNQLSPLFSVSADLNCVTPI